MDAGLLAVISTLVGGGGLKVIEYFIKKSQDKDEVRIEEKNQRETDLAARESAVMTERNAELVRLRQDIDKLQDDLLASRSREDEYRNKFYSATEALITASAKLNARIEKAQEQIE